jgi:hypothetical protein
MAGILTQGITLSYNTTGVNGEFTALTNLMEVPEIGNGAKEKIEVTTLADNVKTYIAGLGDSGQDLTFKFLFEDKQFKELLGMDGSSIGWKVSMPLETGVSATFTGTPSVKFDAASPNSALTYTLTILVESEIVFA